MEENKIENKRKDKGGVVLFAMAAIALAVGIFAAVHAQAAHDALAFDKHIRLADESVKCPERQEAPFEHKTARLAFEDDMSVSAGSSFELAPKGLTSAYVALPADAGLDMYSRADGQLVMDFPFGSVTAMCVASEGDEPGDRIDVFETDGDEVAVAGYRSISESTSAAFVTVVDESDLADAEAVIDGLIQGTAACDGMSIVLRELVFETAANDDVVWSENVLDVRRGEAEAVVSSHNKDYLTAVLKHKLAVSEDVELLHGEYRDRETGYEPFFYVFDDGAFKIVSNSEEAVLDILGGSTEMGGV